MTTRREVFPLLAGAAGASAASDSQLAAAAAPAHTALSEPELKRISYQSERTGKQRDYFVYLPRGFAQSKQWPVMLFLHGNGERGDARKDLDYVLVHGPMFEAWCQRRNLPFVIISPQLPMFGQGDVDYIRNRTRDQIPQRLANWTNPRPDGRVLRLAEAMQGKLSDDKLPDGPEGPPDGWNEIENELLAMVDRTIADFKGDAKRVYLTGLSYGGFGAWFLAARHPEKFAALAPIVGYGHPDHAGPIARAKLPLWVFAGGRDPVVPLRFFYPALNKLEELGHPEVRFTVAEELGHLAWVRIYEGQDLYSWMLAQSR
ncbi:MAG TPA: alpha/beta hydrolase-fold protein [Steroidobacteraceae bacterium]|nr:alpha/beta hydrolase-fold protein [Steroidobacteraceae bacterium]